MRQCWLRIRHKLTTPHLPSKDMLSGIWPTQSDMGRWHLKQHMKYLIKLWMHLSYIIRLICYLKKKQRCHCEFILDIGLVRRTDDTRILCSPRSWQHTEHRHWVTGAWKSCSCSGIWCDNISILWKGITWLKHLLHIHQPTIVGWDNWKS